MKTTHPGFPGAGGDRSSLLCATVAVPPRLHPGITQEVASNENQRDPKPLTSEALISEALFVARWLQSRFEKGS
jgi:hypothetical protein